MEPRDIPVMANLDCLPVTVCFNFMSLEAAFPANSINAVPTCFWECPLALLLCGTDYDDRSSDWPTVGRIYS